MRKERQGKQGQFHEEWYMRLRFPGGKAQFLNTGYDICAKCMACPDSATLRARKECSCRTKPTRVARGRLEAANDERMLGAIAAARMRREVATIGQVITAFSAEGVRTLKEDAYVRRNVNGLRRVVAFARGLWTTHEGGVKGVKIGAQIADAKRIDALPVSVLTAELREAYFRAAQGGTVDWITPAEGNVTINSTLAQATDVFSRKAMFHKLRNLTLPDLEGFRKGEWLPEEDSEPDPLTAKQFDAMLAAAVRLKKENPELELVNMILRQTGLRSGYVWAARRNWLVLEGGKWCLEIKNRTEEGFRKKRGTRNQKIPLSPELAARLIRTGPAGGWLVLPGGTENERKALVHTAHNAWLKAIIGGAGEMTQGNHRLRDTVASVLWSLDRPTSAQEALGHASVDTTAKHYGKKIHVGDGMRRELAAWRPETGK